MLLPKIGIREKSGSAVLVSRKAGLQYFSEIRFRSLREKRLFTFSKTPIPFFVRKISRRQNGISSGTIGSIASFFLFVKRPTAFCRKFGDQLDFCRKGPCRTSPSALFEKENPDPWAEERRIFRKYIQKTLRDACHPKLRPQRPVSFQPPFPFPKVFEGLRGLFQKSLIILACKSSSLQSFPKVFGGLRGLFSKKSPKNPIPFISRGGGNS